MDRYDLYIEAVRKAPTILILLLTGFLLSPIWALEVESAVAVLEAGSREEVETLLRTETLEDLFKVRQDGQGLLHLALRRPDDVWSLLVDAGWPLAREKGWSPQHEAALAGNAEAVVALLKAGAPANLKEPTNGGTPLHVAAFNGHLPVVKALVGAGAKVNARDKDGWTALSQARDQGFPKVIEWLKKNGATR